jgi:phosphohistidine phosphatase
LPKDASILVSPAVRAQQTAQPLKREYMTVKELRPDASPAAILAAAGWPAHAGTVLVVGHQPTLGQTAAWLLSGEPTQWNIKKGALWWITYRERGEEGQVVLRAVMSPEFL